MKKHIWQETILHSLGLALLTGLLLAASGATAQDEPVRQRDRDQDQVQAPDRDQLQDQTRDQLRDRLRDRIDQDTSLGDQDRARLRQHLRDCLASDLETSQVEALFTAPAGKGLGSMLQIQERIVAMSREGLPADLVAEKLREGRMKGASEAALEGALHRMEENVQRAHRFFENAHQDGVAAAQENATQRQLMRGVALNLWRGLETGDLEQLRERARQRLRNHACDGIDLAAASETACQLHELGIARQRAVTLAGEALENGYTAREMRQLGWALMAAKMRGGPPEDVVGRLEQGLRHGETMDGMFQHMMQNGWMGDGDGHHGGGTGPVDDVIGGGPGGPGGSGGHGGEDEGGHHGGHGNG
jgi:hypothetical protein